MNQRRITIEIIQKYLKEVHNREVTYDYIDNQKYYDIVWTYFKAVEHYEGKKIELTYEDVKGIYGR